jgi:hypothetical protein
MTRVAIALLLVASVTDVTQASAQGTSWTFQSENDAYPSWGDDDYTNGLRLSVDIMETRGVQRTAGRTRSGTSGARRAKK